MRVDTYTLALTPRQNGRMTQQIQHNQIQANGVNFSYLECGSGLIALCIHGFPDSAHTWRYLMPELAQAGFRAIAPFTRGYAPTSLAPDDCYQTGARAADVNALHWRRVS